MDVTTASPGGRICPGFSLQRLRAYTLVELLATVAVVAILTSVAVPSLRGLLSSNRLATDVNLLVGDLMLARSEAVRRSAEVQVCRSGDGQRCATRGNWEQGWIVFHDSNGNRQREDSETLLRVQAALAPGHTLRYSGFPSSGYIVYQALGHTDMNGTFTFCGGNPELARAVIVSKTGRPRLSSVRPDGRPLQC